MCIIEFPDDLATRLFPSAENSSTSLLVKPFNELFKVPQKRDDDGVFKVPAPKKPRKELVEQESGRGENNENYDYFDQDVRNVKKRN